jgi:hypothetical protein
MIYLAHFSFEHTKGRKKHGYFTCVVDADNFEAALERIRQLLADPARSRRVFNAPVSIYLDDLIEVASIPPEGFLAHMITREGPLKNAESHSLPGMGPSVGRSFSVAASEKDPDTAEISPFMTPQA